jgi:hypothetical protein
MNPQAHPLFQAYPLDGEATLSVGRVPTPYHTYDGHGTLIGGTADITAIEDILQDEDVYPLRTHDGKAIVALWVVDFTEASLGTHHELQVSILVSHQPLPAVESHPLALLKALFANPAARMFCWQLWNNTDTVVAYNRELLGLPVHLTQSTITQDDDKKVFNFMDAKGECILEGQVQVEKRTAPRVGWSLFRLLGWRQTLRALSQPYLGAKVVNPKSDAVPYNGDAQSFVASETPVVQWYDPANDTLQFGAMLTSQFDFHATFVEHFAPFRFVYLQPQKPT